MSNNSESVISVYPFQGDPALSQLSFPSGATIRVVSKHSEWWFGSWNGQRGWFPPSHCQPLDREPPIVSTSSASAISDFEQLPIMGGNGEIHGAARNFGTSPTFNPGLEDEHASPKKSYSGYDNPFENHPQTDFEKAVIKKNKVKRNIFRGLSKMSTPVFKPTKQEQETTSPAIRVTSVSSRHSQANPSLPKPTVYYDSSATERPASTGAGSYMVHEQREAPPPIPPTSNQQLALEQKTLIEEQTIRQQHELLELQQQQIDRIKRENQRDKKKWWKRGGAKVANQ